MLKLLTRPRISLSHLSEHNSNIIFVTSLILYVHAMLEPETSFYLLWCHLFQTERRTLVNDIKEINENVIKNDLHRILLYGNGPDRYGTNRISFLSTIKFCINSKRFDLVLF